MASSTTPNTSNKPEPKIHNLQEAKDALFAWIEDKGYKEEIRYWVNQGFKQDAEGGWYYEIQMLSPQSVYHVYEDGTIVDEGGFFKD